MTSYECLTLHPRYITKSSVFNLKISNLQFLRYIHNTHIKDTHTPVSLYPCTFFTNRQSCSSCTKQPAYSSICNTSYFTDVPPLTCCIHRAKTCRVISFWRLIDSNSSSNQDTIRTSCTQC